MDIQLGTHATQDVTLPEKGRIIGTHEGKLDTEARERRNAKNARNRSRVHPVGAVHGFDMRRSARDIAQMRQKGM